MDGWMDGRVDVWIVEVVVVVGAFHPSYWLAYDAICLLLATA